MKFQNFDKILLVSTLALVGLGLVMISSASVVISYNNFGYNYYYIMHQFLYGFLPGMFLLYVFQRINLHYLKKYAGIIFLAAIILLLAVFIPELSFSAKGANRWIALGDFSFQPSEIAKLTFIVYLAAWLESKGTNIRNFTEGLAPFSVILLLIAVLLAMQPDIGTLTVVAIMAMIMFYASGAPLTHLAALALSGMMGIFALIKIAPYRMDRLMVFLHPEIDPKGIGYQINQAILALGSGGILGMGFGHSRQKFNYLPESIGDSIFAVIGEELGIIGLVVILVLFLIFALRGFRIARNAPDNFTKFAAVGITSWIVFQAVINIAAITSLMPLTGIPLPFISYGGSSLIVSLSGVGILLNISKHKR